MAQVNMLEAKTNLSRLVEALESGREQEIVLARNGKPVARIVPIAEPQASSRLGIAEGVFGKLDQSWFEEFQALDEVVWQGLHESPAPLLKRRKSASAKKRS